MRYYSYFCIICLLSLSSVASAQYYETGQDPSSLKWMQVRTGRFRVIYPSTYGAAGIDFARSLEEAYSKLTTLYPEKKFRIPVIIHNYTIESNGYVAWAPSRMEIYPTPEQNTIPLEPQKQLALHELTHVLQMESLNKGFTKAMSFVFGQQFPGVVSSLLPLWFLEGDAVFSESVLTQSGRGRAPSFQKELKALAIEKGRIYKYDKAVNGSFRDYVPDHYQTGFQMMAWSYAKYDPSMWKKALDLTAREPFTINPINLSLSRSASLTKKKLYGETFDSLKILWAKDDKASGSRSYAVLNPRNSKKYVSYHSPLIAGKDSIIAVRTSLTDPAAFVLLRPSDKSEKRFYFPGNIYPYFISSGKGKLVWVETQGDPRWENRSWSVVKVMDLKTRSVTQLSRKSRYMAASISPDGNYIAVSENTVENKNNLVMLDAWNGNLLYSVPVPGNASLQRPQWDNTGKKITVIFLTGHGEGIMSFKTSDKSWNTLTEAGSNDLQSSFIRNDSLFFISSSSGTDNVYLQKPDRTVIPVTSSRFGAGDLSVSGNTLIFTDYSTNGNNICSLTLPDNVTSVNIQSATSSFLINRFSQRADKPLVPVTDAYRPKPYRKWQHLLRFHSWMPFYADLNAVMSDPASIAPGLTLVTQNDLSTLISTFGYEYSDNRHKFHSAVKWNGWYFVLESRLDYGLAPVIQKFVSQGSPQEPPDPPVIRPGYELTNTLSLPLLFRNSYFTQYLYLAASSLYQNHYLYLKDRQTYDSGQNQFTGRLYFSNYSRKALRDIYPRWAQILDLSHSFYPFDTDLYGNQSTVRSAFYFPGFLKNQGIKVRLEAEKQHLSKFILGNRASVSRSYDNILAKEIQFVSADYFTPVAYPDFNLSSLIYLTRIRADLFYDLTFTNGNYVYTGTGQGQGVEYHDYRESFRSFGVELLSDFYLFRIPFMISSGIQVSWRKPGEMPYMKFLFNIDLFGMNIGKRRF